MKKSFKQRFREWLMFSDDYNLCQSYTSTIDTIHVAKLDSDKGIRFQIYKAHGGTIIETHFYDRNKDRSYNGLYVVTDDQDLGKEIGKIITIETIKQ